MEAEITLQQLSDKIDSLAKINLIAVKNNLQIEEAAMYTGLSIAQLYRLSSSREIPHKKTKKILYFNKEELDKWIESHTVLSNEQIASKATTYMVTHKN